VLVAVGADRPPSLARPQRGLPGSWLEGSARRARFLGQKGGSGSAGRRPLGSKATRPFKPQFKKQGRPQQAGPRAPLPAPGPPCSAGILQQQVGRLAAKTIGGEEPGCPPPTPEAQPFLGPPAAGGPRGRGGAPPKLRAGPAEAPDRRGQGAPSAAAGNFHRRAPSRCCRGGPEQLQRRGIGPPPPEFARQSKKKGLGRAKLADRAKGPTGREVGTTSEVHRLPSFPPTSGRNPIRCRRRNRHRWLPTQNKISGLPCSSLERAPAATGPDHFRPPPAARPTTTPSRASRESSRTPLLSRSGPGPRARAAATNSSPLIKQPHPGAGWGGTPELGHTANWRGAEISRAQA